MTPDDDQPAPRLVVDPALPEPLQGRMQAARDRWTAWCATNGVSPVRATLAEVQNAILDHRTAGVDTDELVDLIDLAGTATGVWRDPSFLAMRRAL